MKQNQVAIHTPVRAQFDVPIVPRAGILLAA